MSRILFLSNHFITLYSFRKELIRELCRLENDVFISTPADEQNAFFEKIGCKIIPTTVSRRGMNPIKDIRLVLKYRKIINEIKPDIIFSYTIKPNIYGSLASNSLKYKQVCNITGTGETFLNETFLSKLCRNLYRISVKHCYKIFFQNTGDRDYFISNRMTKNNFELLPGSGCNIGEHNYCKLPQEENISFLFIGRVMKLKGIDEYLECAKIIKSKYKNAVFYIAGWNEEEHYAELVKSYEEENIVKYIGFRKDINTWIKKSSCVILPSHGGEGVPNVLLEAAAMGRPCIASRINGSKDVVTDGVTGYLFEPKNVNDLKDKVERFINLPYAEKVKMGQNGRGKIEKEFNRQIVIDKYLSIVESVKNDSTSVH